jgi:hypothetical protein
VTQDIGVVGTLDAACLNDADGRFRVDGVHEAIAARLPAVPGSGR